MRSTKRLPGGLNDNGWPAGAPDALHAAYTDALFFPPLRQRAATCISDPPLE
ncbi:MULTISPECIES: hypothetical protein [Pseudomonadaceae]|uniref:hypothetical protein n=1 Tax=Pseudomonadaceae TaxID=135621 RepID=UPI0015E0FD5E|nr:hypothetical protein [Stutzerimonas degradans]MCQ4277148.1 hypothetical protein [Stutzerimonas degradans]QPT22147.1 hypothetical protein I6G33_02320 [Stutzerimonas degradans]